MKEFIANIAVSHRPFAVDAPPKVPAKGSNKKKWKCVGGDGKNEEERKNWMKEKIELSR